LLACNPTSKACQDLKLALQGQTCGASGKDFFVCSGGGFCEVAMNATSGTCKPPVTDNGACSDNRQCLTPATCSGGKCTVLDVSTCK
jgi:hypothetical protein